MTSSSTFAPDWASPPGDTIVDMLNERKLPQAELAHLLGRSEEDIRGLIEGRISITIGLARQLEQVLGASVAFWMTRDLNYRQATARLHAIDEVWLSEFPLRDMVSFGWLKKALSPAQEMTSCLQFFGVSSINEWRLRYTDLQNRIAFKASPSIDSRPAAVAAWLRQGELEAGQIDCTSWNAVRFGELIGELRTLTRTKDPHQFIPTLQHTCAQAGVTVVIVRAPTGCRASGATRFLAPDKALLQLSFRYLSDDHFWFAFFHEAGHLLLHGDHSLFLEGLNEPSSRLEEEANIFAANSLIRPEMQPQLRNLGSDARGIIRFARDVGVSPGVVVGQMQHLGLLRHRQMNSLKRRFTWGD